MTPIHLAALRFIAERHIDRASGRIQTVDLRDISPAMRERLIDLAMQEPPLIDVDADQVFVTDAGKAVLDRIAS